MSLSQRPRTPGKKGPKGRAAARLQEVWKEPAGRVLEPALDPDSVAQLMLSAWEQQHLTAWSPAAHTWGVCNRNRFVFFPKALN